MSKDRPSIVQAAEYVSRTGSDSRCRSSSSVLRDGNAGSHPRSVLVVSHHLDGSPPRPCDRISGRCRSWGSSRFVPFAKRAPRDAPTALRSFPSADSCASRGDESPFLRGVASPARSGHLRAVHRSVHREPCPLVLAFFAAADGFPLRAAMKAGPRGLAPSSGPLLERPLPAVRARCSLGLVRSVPPPSCSPPPHRER